MDRGGWHPTACLGPERPRLGQQPYDRGRGMSNDRRGCYECGSDGHIRKFCPQLGRYGDPGRQMDRSTGGPNGRWGPDTWLPSRLTSSMGKEHIYSRTETVRESSNGRRPYHDHHDGGDFTSRPRDSGDRHRDKDSKGGHGIVGLGNANATERDGKLGRSSSRKPSDENHQVVGGHRGDGRRDSKWKGGDGKSVELAASGEAPGQSPAKRVVAGGDDLRGQKAVQDDRPNSKSSTSGLELGQQDTAAADERALKASSRDGQWAQQTTTGSEKDADDLVSKRDRDQPTENGGNRDLEGTADQGTRSRLPNRRHSGGKVPLSLLCKDAAEGNLERKYRYEKPGLSSFSQFSGPVGNVRSSSDQNADGEEARIEKQAGTKLDPFLHQVKDDTANEIKSSKSLPISDNGHHVENKCTKDVGRIGREYSERGDARCDEKLGKGKRVSRWDGGRNRAGPETSDEDGNVDSKVGGSVSDVTMDAERTLSSSAAEQDSKSKLADGILVDERKSIEQNDIMVPLSEHGTPDLFNGQDRVQDRVVGSGGVEPGLQLDSTAKFDDCEIREEEGEACEPDDYEDGIDEVTENFNRQRFENVNSSCSGTSMRWNNFQYPQASFGYREDSVDGVWDKNGYSWNGRTGLKSKYRLRYGGGSERSGGRNGFVNGSKFSEGDDDREPRSWGLEPRHARFWEAYPGHSQYRPGSYLAVCNARYLQLERRSPATASPPTANTAVPLKHPAVLSSFMEVSDNETVEPHGNSWMYLDSQGILPGPVGPTATDLHESGEVQSEGLVQREGSNSWALPDHGRSPVDSTLVTSSVENKEPSVARSPRLPQACIELPVPPDEEEHVPEEHYNVENADQDICPPGTEVYGAKCSDDDHEDFRIDERVEKLMEGTHLITGKEKEIIHGVLSDAARRVLHEYELDIAVEESPRSHGGFAEMGDQWKDGDFGSDGQELEGFGFDQPTVTKVDEAKSEDVVVEVATNGVLEATSSAPEPIPRVNSVVSHSHVESNRELWKWPSRGGDWKTTFIVDNAQHSKGEAQGPTEKGYNTGSFKKVVMNEGRSLCGSRNLNLRDPRKQNKEAGRANPVEPMRLQLPKFALKAFAPKPDISLGDHHVNHVQSFVPLLKGSNTLTPKSHSSTPSADVCTQGKDRTVMSGATLKTIKSGKNTSTQGLGSSGAGRSFSLGKQQQQPSGRGPNLINVAVKKESPAVVKSSGVVEKRVATDKHGLLQIAMASNSDSHYKPVPDFAVETFERKASQGIIKGLLDTPSSSDPQLTNLDISKPASATPLKRLFLNRSLLSKENTDIREDHASANTPYRRPHSSALNEGPDVLSQTKKEEKSSIFFVHGGSLSPSLSVMPSDDGVARNSSVEKSRVPTGDTTPQHETHTFDHSTVLANSSLHGTPCDDSAGMMEVEGSDGPASISQDNSSADGEYSSKRKASSLDCTVMQQQKVQQKRRLLKKDCSGDLDKKQTHISHEAGVNSFMPHLIDGYTARAVSAGHTKSRVRVEHRAQNWSSLKPGILRRIFRCLRGDLRTLKNATVTCKSWRAAGMKSKTTFKRAERSPVQGRSLNGVIESSQASPMVHVSRKREDLHSKTKSLKVIGLRESSSRENGESDVHATTDSASKAVSHDGYTYAMSTVEEMTANDSTVDSSVTLFTHGLTTNGVRHLKSNNGAVIIKPNGISSSAKFVRQENDSSVSHSLVKRKIVVGSSHKSLGKASYRVSKPVMGGQRILADKHSSTSVKVEHHSKVTSASLFEGDKTLEKEIGAMIRMMMEVDTHKCFQTANYSTIDSKGVPVAGAGAAKAIDLLAIEKKYKSGAYAGGEKGFKTFKEDVNLMARSGFRNDKDKLTFSTAEKIFKLSHQQFAALENLIAGTLPADSNNQRKGLGPQPFNKAAKSKLKNHHDHPGKKRKAWDINGLQKAKFGMVNKKGRTESSSGDLDSDSDSTEHEARRFSKSKKERRWDSEGESSEDDEDVPFVEEDEETTETEASDSDIPSESEGEDGVFEDENGDTDDDLQWGYHEWGARMTKAAMVPPVTRKYVVVEDYKIVADIDRVKEKMTVNLPEDFEESRQAAKDKSNDSFSHLDIPDMREYKPRKKLGEEVLEQEVYGIDPYTHNLLYDTMPLDISGFSDVQKQQFIEERLLLALNKEVKLYTGSGKAPMEYHLNRVVERISMEADMDNDWGLKDFCEQLLDNMRNRPKDKFVAYRKGLGVVCNKDNGLEKDEFVVEFFGEVYPPWRWYEKQDGIRSLQKKDKDTTPEFYNILYERPKGDATGYDLLVVDAMHKANFASRLCHSCRPNCEAKITAVNNTYIIGVYTLKPIKHGEELTFDYNSVTESKEEYNNAVCLCGSQGCKGSYLNLTGSGTYEEVILRHHGLLDRHHLLLESCTDTLLMEKESKEMRQAGLGACLLSGLPPWAVKYAASLVHFMNFEKTHLPKELLRLKQGVMEEADAEITADGVYNQRLQNLAITLDKLRYILAQIYKDPAAAPAPLRKLNYTDMVQWIWKRDDSVVRELLQCLAPHLSKEVLCELKLDISRHSPQDHGDDLKRSLLWLRDELRRLPATCKARHDAAADLIHIYAHTKHFFTIEDYSAVESAPMDIHPLDLGSNRYSISGSRSWHKTYNREYVWGQLIGWYKQSVPDPGASLTKAARGCLTLPDVSSCYAKSMQHDFRLGYGIKHRGKMISHMEEKPQLKWPNSKIWSQFWCFKNERGLFGSPMLDSVLEGRPLDDLMLHWLKSREVLFVGPWDEQ